MLAETLPVVEITLGTTLKDIPSGPPCVCGQPTKKVFLDEHVMRGETVMVRALHVAGYRHTSDGPDKHDIQYFSHPAMVESLTRASQIMAKRGDLVTPSHFQAAIELHREDVRRQQVREAWNEMMVRKHLLLCLT